MFFRFVIAMNVIKLQVLNTPWRLQIYNEEVNLFKKASAMNVAPKFYDSWICHKIPLKILKSHKLVDVGFILSERYDNTLKGAFSEGYLLELKTIHQYVQQMKRFRLEYDTLIPDIFVKVDESTKRIVKMVTGDWGNQGVDDKPMSELALVWYIAQGIRKALPTDGFILNERDKILPEDVSSSIK